MTTSIDQLTKLNNDYQAAKSVFAAASQKVLKEILKEIFEAHPRLNAIYWSQYTPYFNDGEACVFQVHGANIQFGFDAPSRDDCNSQFPWDSTYADGSEDAGNVVHTLISNLFCNVDDEVMLNMFGDHVTVFLTHDGTDVEEYEHD